jgi:hypothetical protein
MVVGRAHLDDVHPHELDVPCDRPDGGQELTAGQTPGLRRPRARGDRRVEDVHVDREVSRAVGPADHPLDDRVEAQRVDVADGPGLEAVVPGPVHVRAWRAVAADADLEPVADEPALQRPPNDGRVGDEPVPPRPRVGVGVEVDQHHRPGPMDDRP